MLAMGTDEIRRRAEKIASAIADRPGWHARVAPSNSAVGGGSAPGVELPTWVVAIEKDATTPEALERQLRQCKPPVIARIERNVLVVDLRTVFPEQDSLLLSLLESLSTIG
jgi:L-seryl-tRNA(Ser) seleniumtransferase